MTIVGATVSSRDALNHLRSVKPNDGWSIQIDGESMRLLRRNAPLTDHFFVDIHHSPKTNTVVGVLTKNGDTCQILVDGNTGRPVLQKTVGYVSCETTYRGYKPLTASERISSGAAATGANQAGRGAFAAGGRNAAGSSGSSRTSNSNRTRTPNRTGAQGAAADPNAPANPIADFFADMSEEDKELYLKYAKYGFGAWFGYRILSSVFGEGLLFFLVLPGLYLYALQTCPANDTFDAKKEVKRVLRGHHLPDDHPAKPRRGNFLEEWTAKISASVATEVSAAAGGYSVEIAPLLGGCAKHAVVTLPTLGLTCEWVGCNETWYHYRTYVPEHLR